MTLSALKSDLAALTCHPMTDTNIDGLAIEAGRLVLNTDERDDALAELDDARKESADLEKTLKETESEAEKWSQMLNEYESAETYNESAFYDLKNELARFRITASEWAKNCENSTRELVALRKRKGVDAGLFANAREVMTALHSLSAISPEAKAVLTKIQNSV